MKKFITKRKTSILFGILALVPPILLYATPIYLPKNAEGYVCGLYWLGPLTFTVILMALFSMIGVVLNVLSYCKDENKSTLKRQLEIGLLGVPSIPLFIGVIIILMEIIGLI
ncbi:hypothetical protein MNBD_UNCLBAC01-16 [hydrothermal vent metagenome]|uniref:Uncharacterized protein n=1 Tax=hydrothermal vent metagenome TaxID=652676 RepID=A0A3B1DIP1_9ZZZZ